jgi:curved DNA-binding protein CbpA
MNPYLILGVPRDADDTRIRQAYLEAIRTATPDADPQRFKIVSAAYEQIKDEAGRNRYTLFNLDVPGDSPWDAFLRYARLGVKPKPLPFEAMKDYLRTCSKT